MPNNGIKSDGKKPPRFMPNVMCQSSCGVAKEFRNC
jgi:hypothetical protein